MTPNLERLAVREIDNHAVLVEDDVVGGDAEGGGDLEAALLLRGRAVRLLGACAARPGLVARVVARVVVAPVLETGYRHVAVKGRGRRAAVARRVWEDG